ncbi:MAG: hypothetical protein ABSG63_19185 [Spirochaetia bacterium]
MALLVLSALGIGAWHAVGVSLRLAAKMREAMKANVQLLQLDDRLRGLAGRVILPYWAPEKVVRIEAGTMSVPYLDGDPAKKMSMTFKDEVLTVGDGEAFSRFTGFKTVNLSPASDDQDHQRGVSVELIGKDRKPVLITARFGATPLGSAPTQ